MTLRRKILLATVLALVPVAGLLRWNHRGRALCDGVERGVVAFSSELKSSGRAGRAWRSAVSVFGKRQDILGARWIERGKWRIRISRSLYKTDCHALRAWHDGKRVMDCLDEMWGDYQVIFPEGPGRLAAESSKNSPSAFAASFQRPSTGSHGDVWIVTPVDATYLWECDDFRWDVHPASGDLLFEAHHRVPTVVVDWFCWVVRRIDPLAGVQLLAEDNRLPEPSEEWVQNQIARNATGPYVDLHETATQLLVSGQWRAAGAQAKRLRDTGRGMDWATLMDKTIAEIQGQLPVFTRMFNSYREEMGTPWHEPDSAARTPSH